MPIWLQAIVTLFAAVVASGATWATVQASKKKLEAEEAEIISRTALALMESMRIELRQLKDDVVELKAEIVKLEMWAKMLSSQIIELGHKPVEYDG